MPELRDEACTRTLHRVRGAFETLFVLRLITGHNRIVCQSRGIDCDDLGDDHPRAAVGTFGKKVDPPIGNAVAYSVVRQRGSQHNAIAQDAFADFQRAEQTRKKVMLSHLSDFLLRPRHDMISLLIIAALWNQRCARKSQRTRASQSSAEEARAARQI